MGVSFLFFGSVRGPFFSLGGFSKGHQQRSAMLPCFCGSRCKFLCKDEPCPSRTPDVISEFPPASFLAQGQRGGGEAGAGSNPGVLFSRWLYLFIYSFIY